MLKMNIKQMKELEDLKVELSKIEGEYSRIFEQNVNFKAKADELIDAFIQFVEKNGFNVSRGSYRVTATYNNLVLFAETNNERVIVIGEESKELAKVSIQLSGISGTNSFSLPNDPFEAEKVKLKKRMEQIQREIQAIQNPVYAFYNLNNKKVYMTANEAIDGIFN